MRGSSCPKDGEGHLVAIRSRKHAQHHADDLIPATSYQLHSVGLHIRKVWTFATAVCLQH